MPGILAGLRVIELGQVLAGPFVGAIFADLGAEVIKVERPEGGDDARRMGPDFRYGDALTFHIHFEHAHLDDLTRLDDLVRVFDKAIGQH